MRNPFVYMGNAARMALLMCRYGKKFRAGWIQSFDKVHIQISDGGSVCLGKYNQGRGSCYLGVPGGKLKIGSHCFFNINTSITCVDSIQIGDNCKFGNNVVIVDHDHNFRSDSPEFVSSPIVIGDNVWCGANAVILRGTRIGNNCVIGAGTTVTGEIPDNTILVNRREPLLRRIEEDSNQKG